MNKYTASDIHEYQSDRERVQHFPHLYISDNKLAGAIQVIREIYDNATDEIIATMRLNKENTENKVWIYFNEETRLVEIKDKGRGMPIEKLHDLCEVLHSSGKFRKGKDNSYLFSAGLHGVGLKLANFLSDKFKCVTIRDGQKLILEYADGVFKHETTENVDKKYHGTIVSFILSKKYLKELDKLKCDTVMAMIEAKAECCPGIITKFKGHTDNGEDIEETYKGLNIEDIVKKYNKVTSSIWKFEYDNKDKKNPLRIYLAFGYDNAMIEGDNILGYCNYIKNIEGGTHITGFTDGMQDFFKKYMDKSFLSDKDKKELSIKKDDVRLGLCAAINVFMLNPEFKGQYKQELKSEEIRPIICSWIKSELAKLPDKDLNAISSIIKSNAKARIKSLQARAQVKKIGNKISGNNIEKYIDVPYTYTGNYIEEYFVEGDSAGNHVRSARYEFQSVYKMRGKLDNVWDKPLNKLNDIKIVQDICTTAGVLPGKKGKLIKNAFKILTDADADGYLIRLELIVLFAKAIPQAIDEHKLFVVIPPLYSFIEDGETKFMATSRDYMSYLQHQFMRKNKLYYKTDVLKQKVLLELLVRNERYREYLKASANDSAVSPVFMEYILYNIRKLGIKKDSVNNWEKVISKYSNQYHARWDKCLIIEGIKNEREEIIQLTNELFNDERTTRVFKLFDLNLNQIYGYSINNYKDNLSLYQVMKIFNKFAPKNIYRFKGLGQMDANELADSIMNLNIQVCKEVTWANADQAYEQLAILSSKKPKYLKLRSEMMDNYIPDILDIDT